MSRGHTTGSEEMSPDAAPPSDGSPSDIERDAVERSTTGARLMAELRQAQARADRAERELERTRRTAAYVVGDLCVRAAKDPRRLLTLPRDLWRTWRLRRARRNTARPTGAPARTRAIIDLDAARLLVPRMATVPAGRGMSIVGALGSATLRAWTPYAAVSPTLPHEGAAVVETLDPDVVVIDTSAAGVGEAWSHLGDPAAVDRLMAASALVDAAHALGRPVVLLRMTPPSHTAFLDDLARRCDLVLDGPGAARQPSGSTRWHPGVDPLAGAPLPDLAALLVTGHGEGSHAALMDVVTRAAPRHHRVDPTLPDDLAWSRALAAATGLLAQPLTSAVLGAHLPSVAALAAGRRVLAPGDQDLEQLLSVRPGARGAAHTGLDAQDLATWAAAGPEPLGPDEHRAAFAAILLHAAAPVQLTELARLLGIPTRPRSCWDIALIADDDVDPDRVIRQSWRPRELVLHSPISDRARAALAEADITVVAASPGERIEPALLGLASPHVAQQVDLRDPHDLVDLLAARLLAQPTPAHPTDARLVSAT
jgi:hypothetical protein